ncbi:hypothetical protein WJX84_007034 [Apatococcus fuscideae]|uniref:Aspartokinase n=1 Tax=Apatococcus fuscideae TaxID=2026836 RepID=A0AAW1STB3_9CHLO
MQSPFKPGRRCVCQRPLPAPFRLSSLLLRSTRHRTDSGTQPSPQGRRTRRQSKCLHIRACLNAAAAPSFQQLQQPGQDAGKVTVVMKFGGSSVANAQRMREVADIICSFPEHLPCIVLSAMGKTTNLLLAAGSEALTTDPSSIPSLQPLRDIKELHRKAAGELRVDGKAHAEMESLLNELQQLLVGISIMQDLTPRALDSLASFGERLSTRIFAAFLRAEGLAAQQYDAWDLGLTSTDDFTNADVLYEPTLAKIAAKLAPPGKAQQAIPVVTGFLARGINTGAITTLGRGGSDLSATVIGAALDLPEVQVWKDVDGVLTSDPRIVTKALPVPLLTYEEATELAFFGAQVLHPQAMQPALQSRQLAVRVKNSYNRRAGGTVIVQKRDMQEVLMTSIVLKDNVTLLDVVSTRMLGQFGFLSTVFGIFADNKISVDVVATSEISISLTLDPSKMWSRDLIDEELDALVHAFEGVAKASYQRNMSIISLICNIDRTSEILEKVFKLLDRIDETLT